MACSTDQNRGSAPNPVGRTSQKPVTFPALRGLGDLADNSPVIVIDTREQAPLVFSHLQSVRGTLTTGDYSIAGLTDLFAIERKSINDLVSCCTGDRERFCRELHRLRGFRFKRLLIVGSRGEIETMRYHSRISPKAVLGSLSAWEMRFDCPVVYCATPELASREIECWVHYFCRELVESINGLHRGSAPTSIQAP
jgi:DNA excision repair protein ERCC-4